jgi:hypothetical protein
MAISLPAMGSFASLTMTAKILSNSTPGHGEARSVHGLRAVDCSLVGL